MKQTNLPLCHVCYGDNSVEEGLCAECFSAMPMDEWVSVKQLAAIKAKGRNIMKREPIGAYVTYMDTYRNEERTSYFSFGDYDDDDAYDSYGIPDNSIQFYTNDVELLEHAVNSLSGNMFDDMGAISDINYQYQNDDELAIEGVMGFAERFLTAGSFRYVKVFLAGCLGAAVLWVYVSLILRGLGGF